MLIIGTSLYNKVFRVPFFRYPTPAPLPKSMIEPYDDTKSEEERALLGGSTEGISRPPPKVVN